MSNSVLWFLSKIIWWITLKAQFRSMCRHFDKWLEWLFTFLVINDLWCINILLNLMGQLNYTKHCKCRIFSPHWKLLLTERLPLVDGDLVHVVDDLGALPAHDKLDGRVNVLEGSHHVTRVVAAILKIKVTWRSSIHGQCCQIAPLE